MKIQAILLFLIKSAVFAEVNLLGVENDPKAITDFSSSEYYCEIKHVKQLKNLCVAASAEMVLKYYGVNLDQKEIKKRALGKENPELNDHIYTVTLFRELIQGLKSYGINWEELDFAILDYQVGLKTILIELQNKRPVLVDTTLYGGHTVVIHGYLPEKQKLLITDPNLQFPGVRVLAKEELEMIWNSSGQCRALVLTKCR